MLFLFEAQVSGWSTGQREQAVGGLRGYEVPDVAGANSSRTPSTINWSSGSHPPLAIGSELPFRSTVPAGRVHSL